MDVYLKIICACETIPTIKQRVASLCSHVNADAYTEEVIPQYWKCERCSVYIVQFRCHNPNLGIFESELTNISGGKYVEVERDELHIELSCHTTVSELLSNTYSSFVTCYISSEQNG